MKSFLISVFFLGSCLASISQGLKVDDWIQFKMVDFKLGKIPANKPVTVYFDFRNPGRRPLLIESATAECGCTTPEFPKTPIMPGKQGRISVTYDAKQTGAFTKKVTVKLVNVPETKILTIQGEVKG